MDDMERLLIERACERLVTCYCHYVDSGAAGRVPELFTADGRLTGAGLRMEGHAELQRWFQVRQDKPDVTSAHLCQNFLCDVVDDDHATSVTYFSLHRHDGELSGSVAPLGDAKMVGEYHDKFERTGEGWRIADRRLRLTFVRD